jgi:predicted Zn finger-like uncharacterized protein
MLTCCPACRTCFRITEAQLAVAQGKVRCGKCKTVFNARQHLKPLPGQTVEESPATAPATPAPPQQPPASEPVRDSNHIDLFMDSEAPVEPEEKPIPIPTEPEEILPPEDIPAEIDEPDTVHDLPVPDFSTFEPMTESGSDDQPATEENQGPYKYNDFDDDDEIVSEQELDDILAELNQQLSPETEEPAPKRPDSKQLPKDSTPSTSRDELGQAIDNLFADLEADTDAADLIGESQELEELDEIEEIEEIAGNEPAPEPPAEPIDEQDRDELASQLDFVDDEDKQTGSEDKVPLRLRESLAVEPPKPRSWLAITGSSLLILILLVLMAGQLLLFRPLDVDRWLPQSRPYLERLCQYADCHFTTNQDLEKIRLANRDVRAHPDNKKALLITATLINEAEFAQSYPDLQVTLFDLSGNRVAQRRFTPRDYLGDRYSPFMLMQPQTPLQIKLDVVDPGSNAVNFEFNFM